MSKLGHQTSVVLCTGLNWYSCLPISFYKYLIGGIHFLYLIYKKKIISFGAFPYIGWVLYI